MPYTTGTSGQQENGASPSSGLSILSRAGPRPIDRYMALRALRELSPGGYHRLMLTHGQEVLPYIYTPTVGQACQEYHTLGIKTRGLYVSLEDRWVVYLWSGQVSCTWGQPVGRPLQVRLKL